MLVLQHGVVNYNAGGGDLRFILELTIPYGGYIATIPHLDGYVYDYDIDWGDGSSPVHVSSYNDPNCSHEYASASAYTVTILGTCETFYVDGSGTMPDTLQSVIAWGNVGLKELNLANCYTLTGVTSDTAGAFSQITSMTEAFYYCYGLTSIPSGLFTYCTNVTTFDYTFYYCYNLLSVPAGLFNNCTSAISFNATFGECYALTTIGAGAFDNCTNVTNFQATFQYCFVLESIPSGLFDDLISVTNFTNVFFYCYTLTSIPDGLFNNCTSATNYQQSFYQCTSLTGEAPELWFGPAGAYGGYNCFLYCTGLSNFAFIPSYWGGGGQTDTRFKIEITTTSPSQSITIPHLNGYSYNYVVDYGDGSSPVNVTSYNDTGCTHTYTTAGVYKLKISGVCETISINFTGTMKPTVTEILAWGDVGLQYFDFAGCSNLTTIPNDNIGGLALITDFTSAFNSCTSLTSIPSGLFTYATSATDFSYAFSGCTSLTGVAPELWYLIPEPTGTNCFSGDVGLTNYQYIPVAWGGLGQIDNRFILEITTTGPSQSITIPHLSGYVHDYIVDYGDSTSPIHVTSYDDTGCTHTYATAGTYEIIISGICETFWVGWSGTMYYTLKKVKQWGNTGLIRLDFQGCQQLTSIANDYVSGLTNVTQFQYTFYYCSSLTTVPARLFKYVTGATNFSGVFYYCSSLTTIPVELFKYVTGATTFSYAFYQCTALTTVPSGLFSGNTLVNDFGFTFYNCYNITSAVPTLWISHPSAYGADCFKLNYNASNYTSIPEEWGGIITKFRLRIETTSPSQSITIPHLTSTAYTHNYIVNYGDGTGDYAVTGATDPNCTHTYTYAGLYFIKISGVCETFFLTGGTMMSVLTRVAYWGNVGIKVINFSGSTTLTHIPNDIINGLELVSDFTNAFANCSNLVCAAPTFWTQYTGATGTDCFLNDTKLYNYDYIPTAWGGLGGSPAPFMIEVSTNYDGQYIQLPHRERTTDGDYKYVYDYYIDWGDGSPLGHVTSYNDADTTHIYATASGYTITISGICETFLVNWGGYMPQVLRKILQWGHVGFLDFNCMGCTTSLKAVEATDGHGMYLITNFQNTFYYCQGLTGITATMFSGCTEAWQFSSTFNYCTSLATIPSGLFDDCSKVEGFYSVFQNCPITSIPSGLFDSFTKVTGYNNAFYNCTSLTSIPSGLFNNCPLVYNFQSVFYNCTSLTSIPSDLFSGFTGTTQTYAYYQSVFYNCTSLTGSAPELWNLPSPPYRQGSQCYYNCTGLDNYAAAVTAGWA